MNQKEIDTIRRCLDWEREHPGAKYFRTNLEVRWSIAAVLARPYDDWKPVPLPKPNIVEYQNQYKGYGPGQHSSIEIANEESGNTRIGIICRILDGATGELIDCYPVNEKGERLKPATQPCSATAEAEQP